MALFPRACPVCLEKDGLVARLWAEVREAQAKPCRVCAAHVARIESLERLLDAVRQERAEERSEYKRSVDVLLEQLRARPIGQGVAPGPAAAPTNLHDMMDSLFSADVGQDGTPQRLTTEERVGS